MSARRRSKAPVLDAEAGAPLYAAVARRLAAQIGEGTYGTGVRLPSVRELARRLGVSTATVQQSYGLLLDQRAIESRPRSGYFVRAAPRAPAAPAMSKPRPAPTAVSVADVAFEVVHAAADPALVAFGSATPADDLEAPRRMERLLAQTARRLGTRALAYEPPPGNRDLRLQIARRAVDAGCSFSPDDVVITSGCQEALVLCLRAVTSPGDAVAVESPTFYGTLQAIRSLGLRALELPTDPETGVSLEALELALEEWPVKACVLTPSGNNPLGYVMPDERKADVVRLLEKHDVPVIEDDIYGELAYAPVRPPALKSWDRRGQVLLCSSVSKTIAPGLRVGWAVPGRHLRAVEHLKLVSSMASATLPQAVVAAYLEQGGFDRHLRAARTLYRQRRDRFLDLVAAHFPAGTKATRPAGGFLGWLELPRKVDALALYAQALEAGVSVAPGPLFSAREKYRSFVRLNFARRWDERAVAALRRVGALAARMAAG
jgi:DNA-binding transcriptional MocR family regulator